MLETPLSQFVSSHESFKRRFDVTIDDCFLTKWVEEKTFRKRLAASITHYL